MVKGLPFPALWMRGSSSTAAAAAEIRHDDGTTAGTTETTPQNTLVSLPVAHTRDGATTTHNGASEFSAMALQGPCDQGNTTTMSESVPATTAVDTENEASLTFCGAASPRPSSSEDEDVESGLRSTVRIDKSHVDPVFNDDVYCIGEATRRETATSSPCDDFDSDVVATAATAVQDTEGDIFDEEDALDCTSNVNRDTVAELFNEKRCHKWSDDEAVKGGKKKTGFFATGVIILKSFVGGAFLFIPHAVMKAGLALSLVTLILVFVLAVYCMTLLVGCCEANEKCIAQQDDVAGSDRIRRRRGHRRNSIDEEGRKNRRKSSNDCGSTDSSTTETLSGKTEKKSSRSSSGWRIDSLTDFRRLVQPSQYFSGGKRKCVSSCSRGSTDTGISGDRRLSSACEVEQGVTIQHRDDQNAVAAAVVIAAEHDHQQLSSKDVREQQQQVADETNRAGRKPEDFDAEYICIDGREVTPDRRENCFSMERRVDDDEHDRKRMYEVLVTEDVKPHAGIAEGTQVDRAAEEERASAEVERKGELDVTAVASEFMEAAAAEVAEVAEAATSIKETTSQAMLCSYEGVARVACGLWGERLIEACVVLSQLSFATVNVVLVAGNVRDVVWTAGDCAPTYDISVKAIIWATALLYVPLCMLRKMRHLVPLALVANVGTAAALVLLLISVSFEVAKRQQQQPAIDLPLARWNSWPLILGTSVYLWEGAGLVLPIRQAAKQSVQKRFSAFFSGSLACVLLLYIGYSVTCCFAFPEKLQIIILFNLANNWQSLTIQTISALAILATYPLMMLPALSIVERHLLNRQCIRRLRSSQQKYVFYFVRGILALLTLAVATLGMRQLDDFVALIGGLCGAPLVFVFPVYFHMRLVEEKTWRKVFHCCVITLGLAIQCFSVYWSVASWKGGSDFAARCIGVPPAAA